MFGFACDETPELMPLPIALAHRLAERLTEVRKNGTVPYLRPDGKTQVTIEYVDGKPVRLDTVVVSSQHAGDIDLDTLLKPDIEEHVVAPVLAALGIDTDGYRLLVNPTGRFEIGGPMGDAGLTGRKIIVDTYGGIRPPRRRRVLRQGPVEGRPLGRLRDALGGQERRRRRAGHRCEVQVAYAIGKAEPVGLFVETFGTETVDAEQDRRGDPADLRPAPGRDHPRPRPASARSTPQTAAYGHFGRELPDFTWERTDRAERWPSSSTASLGPRRAATTRTGPHDAACAKAASSRARVKRARLGSAGCRPRVGAQTASTATSYVPGCSDVAPQGPERSPRVDPVARVWSTCRCRTSTGPSTTSSRRRWTTRCGPARGCGCASPAGWSTPTCSSARAEPEHDGRLAYVERAVGGEPVLTPETTALFRAVADRWAGNFVDVVRLGVPPRHARPRRGRGTAPRPAQPDAADADRVRRATAPGRRS